MAYKLLKLADGYATRASRAGRRPWTSTPSTSSTRPIRTFTRPLLPAHLPPRASRLRPPAGLAGDPVVTTALAALLNDALDTAVADGCGRAAAGVEAEAVKVWRDLIRERMGRRWLGRVTT